MSDQTFDAVVVGGGIMGCSTAFQLSKRGLSVAVVEKNAICTGSTGRSSAIVRQHYSNKLTARMALYGLRVFQNFDERVGGECGFEPRGFLVLVPMEDREGLESNVALQRGVGINTEVLQPEAVGELLPGANPSDLVAAAYEPESGYADPHLTTHSFADAAKRNGARFLLGTEVTGVCFEGGHVTGVDTSANSLSAPIVINCAGPWGARVAALAGLEVPVSSCRIQVGVFKRPAEAEAPHPVVLDFVHASYFRPETGGLTLVGLIDPAEANAVVDPDDYPEHADDDYMLDVGGRWVQRCPPMEMAERRRGYSGLYGVTPDWHPVIDEVPEGSGHFLCTGFSGHGFKLAPAAGLMTAELATGEGNPQFDPSLFRLSRFSDGQLVRGRYDYSITG